MEARPAPGMPLQQYPDLFQSARPWTHKHARPQVLGEETQGEAIIATGVGQHQMWAAQWYPYKSPRQWISSGGLGSMGFGLPAALGCAAAFDGKNGRPKKIVVDIDGDGSFLMNPQVRKLCWLPRGEHGAGEMGEARMRTGPVRLMLATAPGLGRCSKSRKHDGHYMCPKL